MKYGKTEGKANLKEHFIPQKMIILAHMLMNIQ